MSLQNFKKPSLDVEQQLLLLQNRGLLITNFDAAIHSLKTVSYYRLSVYCKPHQDQLHNFKPNTNFDMIWNLYSFDRELRLLFVDAIERIEVAFRTALINCMSTSYESTWYANKNLFKDYDYSKKKFHIEFIESIEKICRNPKDDFLQHFKKNYSDQYPPSWMAFECLSFGTLSLIFKNLKHMKDKNYVSRTIGYHATLIESWIESLVFTRNTCAHHSRLWNRWFLFRPQLPKNYNTLNLNSEHTIYEQIIIIKLLLKNICPESNWSDRLFNLFNQYHTVSKSVMGFSDNWQQDRIWSK